ncbi:MAG: VWA domain-containing protein [Acidobacteriota bacterium]
MKSGIWNRLCLVMLAGWLALPAGAGDLVLVLDASGSMWGQIDGTNKIVLAREALDELIADLPGSDRVGLIAYGHRREGDCADIEALVPLGPLDKAALRERVQGIAPKGKTPITDALEKAFEMAPEGATVLLISDGLETCGGDPCKAVAARQGASLVVHVVGFGIEEDDVSQLECAAQAGGGLYFDAQNGAELSAALGRVVELPADFDGGYLSLGATADGELTDVSVRVRDADGEVVATARTYTQTETNPSRIPLPAGTLEVTVRALALDGSSSRTLEPVVIVSGETVERSVDFSSGELTVGVTRNGELSDATVRVRHSASGNQQTVGRTYGRPDSNPRSFRVPPGLYDVELKSVEIAGRPEVVFEGVEVAAGGSVRRDHEFATGVLRLSATLGGQPVDATVRVFNQHGGQAISTARTYDSVKDFTLLAGSYRVDLRNLESKKERSVEVTVETGKVTEREVIFE